MVCAQNVTRMPITDSIAIRFTHCTHPQVYNNNILQANVINNDIFDNIHIRHVQLSTFRLLLYCSAPWGSRRDYELL